MTRPGIQDPQLDSRGSLPFFNSLAEATSHLPQIPAEGQGTRQEPEKATGRDPCHDPFPRDPLEPKDKPGDAR
jgi:hypothetical protein